MSEEKVLVSVGVPVRDGAKTLALALETLINQTHDNIEIIISDNASTDQTGEICKQFAEKDSRIVYFRQNSTFSAIENFRFVYEKSHGKYFMWAAHDDLRDNDYIETLLKGFEKEPTAAIMFSEVVLFDNYSCLHKSYSDFGKHKNWSPTFQSKNLSFLKKHVKQQSDNIACIHIYGLINPKYLFDYPWFDSTSAPDLPLLHWLLSHGDFLYYPGTTLYYYVGHKNSVHQISSNFHSVKKIINILILIFQNGWICALSVKKAELKNGHHHHIFLILLIILSARFFFRFIKPILGKLLIL
ncbi:MAG: hypothetical protein BWK78_01490 [Thiotrichaceae bacterium IS1]|nr:MAG: hypothetical protein BWK78_01490 [Thiotrichaceae bacterium IS1]